MSRCLLLIDGLSMLRRIYEAQKTPDSPEKAEGAMASCLSSLTRAFREHTPTHVLFAVDAGGHTFRHDIFPAYRQNRSPMPQALADVIPKLLALLAEAGVATARLPGVEADDVVASAFTTWHRATNGARCIVLSTDKDLAALVARGAEVRDHFNRVWRDRAWIQNKFGVPAEKLTDLLALMGDKVDGIPGVPGIGPKTAAKYLTEYATDIDHLLSQEAFLLANPKGQKIAANRELLLMSRELVKLNCEVRLGLTASELRFDYTRWMRVRTSVPAPAAAPAPTDHYRDAEEDLSSHEDTQWWEAHGEPPASDEQPPLPDAEDLPLAASPASPAPPAAADSLDMFPDESLQGFEGYGNGFDH